MLVYPTALFHLLAAMFCRWGRCTMLIASMLLYVIAPAQQYLVNYRLIGIEDGLSSREITCGLQDERGFLWFGSGNGIIRYDGANFITLNRTNSALRGDRVIEMATDNEGLTWVLYSPSFTSQSAGKVDLLNATNRAVVSFKQRFPKAPFTEEDIYFISANGDGQVQIYLNTGEVYYYSKGIFKKYIGTRAKDGTHGRMFNGKVWVSEANLSAWWLNAPTKPCTKIEEGMMVVYAEGDSNLIVFTNKPQSSWHILKDNCQLKPLSVKITKAQQEELFDGHLNIIRSTSTNEALIHNVKNGLYLFHNRQVDVLLDKEDLQKLSDLTIFSFFKDRFGNLWLCTSIGILKLSITENRFSHYLGQTGSGGIFQENQARAICVDSSNNAWVLQSNNVFKFDSNGRQSLVANLPNGCFGMLHEGDSLFITGNSIFKTKADKGKLLQVSAPTDMFEAWAIMRVDSMALLLGGRYGIETLDLKTGKSKKIEVAEKLGNKKSGWVLQFAKKSDGNIWAVADDGLYVIDHNLQLSEWYHPNASDSKHKLPFYQLLHLYKDGNGIIWLATNRHGLLRWNPVNNQVRSFTIDDGLSANILYRIEQDAKGYLWISSDNGLMCFDTTNFKAKIYTTKDGLASNEFNRPSSCRAADGRMYFGGLNGVNTFYPKDFWADSGYSAPLQVVSFQQYRDKLYDYTNELLSTGHITINPGDKFFVLQFVLLDYDNARHAYAYKIEGMESRWTDINENSIRISGLDPGNYTLCIKAQNLSGRWQTSQLRIPVTVVRPLQQRLWFRILVLLVICLFIYAFVRYRTYRLVKAKGELEGTVAMRTEQMRILLEEKDVLLKEIHHRVKNNLQVISNLLDLQSNEYSDSKTQSAFSEAKARVQSIALIHQNLYRHDNLSGIELHQFINELVVLLKQLFETDGKTITVHNDVPHTHLDIDTAVPLGLILNELLTNAYKYAFNNRSGGNIYISLTQVQQGVYELTVLDDGPGLPQATAINSATTLGMRMVRRLAVQLMGKVTYSYNSGSSFTVRFKDHIARKQVK